MKPQSGITFSAKNQPETEEASPVKMVQNREDLDLFTVKSIDRYGAIIQKYAYLYQVDWRLILAVMNQESRFSPKALSYRGAYGLMQIMPVTAEELIQKLRVSNTRTPYNNIKAGIFHLKSLYRYFGDVKGDDRIMLTLAAYNAGLSRIQDAQDIAQFLGDDPKTWKSVKDAMPLLSNRYKTLHTKVWNDGMPRSGYFKDWLQTTNYVDNIMQYYDKYQLAFR